MIPLRDNEVVAAWTSHTSGVSNLLQILEKEMPTPWCRVELKHDGHSIVVEIPLPDCLTERMVFYPSRTHAAICATKEQSQRYANAFAYGIKKGVVPMAWFSDYLVQKIVELRLDVQTIQTLQVEIGNEHLQISCHSYGA